MTQRNESFRPEHSFEKFGETFDHKELGVLLFEQTAKDLGSHGKIHRDNMNAANISPDVNRMLENFVIVGDLTNVEKSEPKTRGEQYFSTESFTNAAKTYRALKAA